jgi:hypothetical protein
MGCMIPQPFATRGNWLYLEFWAITGDPWYLGYYTPTKSNPPGTHMVNSRMDRQSRRPLPTRKVVQGHARLYSTMGMGRHLSEGTAPSPDSHSSQADAEGSVASPCHPYEGKRGDQAKMVQMVAPQKSVPDSYHRRTRV